MATITNIVRESSACETALREAARVLEGATRGLEQRLRDDRVSREVPAGSVGARLAERYTFDRPRPLEELAPELFELLYETMVHPNHPRHFGLFVPGTGAAGVVADALAALLNPQLGSWWYAPGASELESYVLGLLAARIGFDPAAAAAHFTSGGQEANATAVLMALTRAFPEYGRQGLSGGRWQPVFYASEQAHDSFEKIAHLTGLGRAALRRVRTDAAGRLELGDLRRQHARDLEAGAQPFLVVGTAGTTAAGAIDPLRDLAAFSRQSGLWLHVDAAWGGLALLVDELRPLLAGIELADSVTWDAHKGLPVPMGAGMFFARRGGTSGAAFGVETGYVPQAHDGTLDLYQHSMQWSRRFIGLKVFLTLAELGWDGVAALLRQQALMGTLLREELTQAGFALVQESALPLVCFTHPVLASGQRTADEVVARLLARGGAWISSVALAPDARKVLRACITSHRTGPEDVRALVAEVHGVL